MIFCVQLSLQYRILLPHLKFEGPVCVEFCYFMHGYHMGALEVYTQDTEAEKRTSHMTIEGPRGEEWLIERITLEEIDDGQQVFVIEIDNDERGVIRDFTTISDIRITKAEPE